MRNDADLIPSRDIRVFDNALSEILFARLVRALDDIGTEQIEEGYNTTFWYPRGKKPTNLAEEVVTALIELAEPPLACIGTEWWFGRLAYGEKLPLHFDRDLTRSRKFGRHEYPIYGSIFYVNSFPTSPTIILGQIPGSTPKVKTPKKPMFRESVDAVANRYVVFRGNLRHGVVPDADAVGKDEGRIAVRQCLLVNYWHIRPMSPICRDYDGSVYSRLQHHEASNRKSREKHEISTTGE